jgi:hypothetical protein
LVLDLEAEPETGGDEDGGDAEEDPEAGLKLVNVSQ